MSKPLTLASIERDLRALIRERSVRIERVPLGRAADAGRVVAELEAGERKLTVRLDPHTVCVLEGVLHELSHELLDDRLSQHLGELHEPFIVVVEEMMARRIMRNSRSLAWWRDAIDTRIRPVKVE